MLVFQSASALVWVSVLARPSSSVIVKTAVAGAPWIAGPIALLSVRLTVSAPSATLSLQIAILKVLLVSPGLKLSVTRCGHVIRGSAAARAARGRAVARLVANRCRQARARRARRARHGNRGQSATDVLRYTISRG